MIFLLVPQNRLAEAENRSDQHLHGCSILKAKNVALLTKHMENAGIDSVQKEKILDKAMELMKERFCIFQN